MTDRLLKPEEYESLIPWRCHEKGEAFIEIGGDRVFIPRLTLIHIFQRYSEVVAGMAAKKDSRRSAAAEAASSGSAEILRDAMAACPAPRYWRSP